MNKSGERTRVPGWVCKSSVADPLRFRIFRHHVRYLFAILAGQKRVIRMNFAVALRQDLAVRAQRYARSEGLPHCLSYGDPPSVCFTPHNEGSRHGNFLAESYKAIQGSAQWSKRLEKVHAQGLRRLPRTERGRWMELDSCASSDALLMNIFCHPSLAKSSRISALLGVSQNLPLSFGYRARVPLANGRFDRTEVDLRFGDLLIEAKLTEGDFQNAARETLLAYRDFSKVFDVPELPQTADRFGCYQLLRNILAAFALDCSFCALIDTRRPDLADAWYAVMKCVKSAQLRTRLRIGTWQEVAEFVPPKVQAFLAAKYGIRPGFWWGYESECEEVGAPGTDS